MYHINNMYKNTTWTDHGPFTTYEFEFGFESREQYLEQTAGWKAEYKELSNRIREWKRNRKQARRHELGLSEWNVQHKLNSLREQARQMCAMRVQAKAEAGRQMRAQAKAA